MISGGYAGKLLRVDLSAGTVQDEPLPSEEVLRKYIGGLGLGAWIVYNEVPLTVDGLDPENRLVFTTGPITGTIIHSSSDWTVTSIRQELKGKAIHGSHSHGYWGAFLKLNGYDGIIVQGAAEKPVYLWIHDGKAEIRDASKVWGLDTHETEDAVKADLETNEETSVAAIGPAGENLVEAASIENDKMHSASKGMGCIMGSKKLKAIAVTRGPYPVPVANPMGLLEVAHTWHKMVEGTHVIAHAVRARPPDSGNAPYFTTGKNFGDPEWSKQFRYGVSTEAEKYPVNPRGCWACPSPCAYRILVTSGPHAGYEATLAGGFENSEGAAAMAGVDEPGTVLYLTDLVDRLGLDVGTVSCAIGVAIEAYEKGILTKERTGGLELRWGDAELTEKLWRMVAAREGFGEILAEGPKPTAEYIGGEALNMVVHVKGAGPNLHDWRARPSIIVGQAVCPAGPCWQGSLGVELYGEPDLGFENQDPWTQEGKGTMLAGTQKRATFEDVNGVCWFAANLNMRRMPGYHNLMARSIAEAVGWDDFTQQEVLEVGERIMTLQRAWAVMKGMRKADDLDIGPRFMEPHQTGPHKGLDIRPHLIRMVEEFYEGMGWDKEEGRPLPQTLLKLGLEDLIPRLYPEEAKALTP